jgi:hypothetical protein
MFIFINKWDKMYILTYELHLHGHLGPASRRMRPALTVADPVLATCQSA